MKSATSGYIIDSPSIAKPYERGVVGVSPYFNTRAILVEKENYLLELCRYVVLNPVRANLVERPEHWKWSSYGGTVDKMARMSLDTRNKTRPYRHPEILIAPTRLEDRSYSFGSRHQLVPRGTRKERIPTSLIHCSATPENRQTVIGDRIVETHEGGHVSVPERRLGR